MTAQAAELPSFDTLGFRRALGAFLTGVTVVTTRKPDGTPVGFTANSFTSVSLEPPLVLVCLAKTSGLAEIFAQTPNYAVNVLAESQQALSDDFASPSADRFEGVAYTDAASGAPLISAAASWFDCRQREVIDAGDHLILLGEVNDFGDSDAQPLGYLRGNYVRLSLQQTAARALEDADQATRVGAIIEYRETADPAQSRQPDQPGQLLLIPDDNGGWTLPTAHKFGHDDQPDSLCGQLASMGLSPKEKYLYSVFESQAPRRKPQGEQSESRSRDQTTGLISIYYRAQLHALPAPQKLDQARFFAFDDLPFEAIASPAIRTMLKRYLRERASDAFGIYTGSATSGSVEHPDGSASPLNNEAA